MNFLKKWLVEKLLGSYVKGALDWLSKKLGVDGLKTIIGVLLLVLSAVATAQPQYSEVINAVITYLQPYGADLYNMGLGTAVVGMVHKLLKLFVKDDGAK